MARQLDLIPPGEILLEEFMLPLSVSQNRLARDTGVPATRIHEIIHGRRGISADTALRLGAFFGTSAEFWVNLQARYDLDRAQREMGAKVKKEVRPLAA